MIDFGRKPACQYSFFSFLQSLISKGWLNDSLTKLKERPFKILPAGRLSFPAADIDKIEETAKGWELRCNFMGLYGVDSPLPMYLNQQALAADTNAQAFREFLDLLHQRSYQLYFMSWQTLVPEYSHRFNPLCAALGLKETSYAEVHATPIEKLRQYISHLIPEAQVKFCSPTASWRSLRKPCSFQFNELLNLGDNSFLGNAVYDAAGCYEITIGPVDCQAAEKLQPGQPVYQQLRQYIASHFEPCLKFLLSVELCIENTALKLGMDRQCLGWNTMISPVRQQGYLNKLRLG